MDDLTRINGIGEARAADLNRIGVTSFAELAALSDAKINEIDAALNLRGAATRDGWRTQAAALAEEPAAQDGEDEEDDDPEPAPLPAPAPRPQQTQATAPAPRPRRADRLDWNRPYGKVFGRIEGWASVTYEQDGKFFDASGQPARQS